MIDYNYIQAYVTSTDASGGVQLIAAPTGGLTVKIHQLIISAAATMGYELKTGAHVFTGGHILANTTFNFLNKGHIKATDTETAVTLTTSGAGVVRVTVLYTLE